eukprot:2765993-Lingulodinium_polyedra.AAC.1
MANMAKKKGQRAVPLRRFHRFLVTTNPRGRSTAKACGCLNDSLQSYSSRSGKFRWREPCAQLLV